jgi:hypothetical protein
VKNSDGGGRVVQSLPKLVKESAGQRTQDWPENKSEMLYLERRFVAIQENLQSKEM